MNKTPLYYKVSTLRNDYVYALSEKAEAEAKYAELIAANWSYVVLAAVLLDGPSYYYAESIKIFSK